MADLGQMVVRIVGDNSGLDSAIDSSESKLKSFSSTAAKLGTVLSLSVTTPLVAMATAAVKSSATMEMLQASFTTMLGSATKATELMTKLKEMAAVTPFETTDLANASKTLLQFGISADKLLPTLQMLGDISSGNNQKFMSLSLAFGQMSSAGRLMGQDLLQMINAGFNPLKIISEKTGESMSSLKDKMSKGQISVEMVTKAFEDATSKGGLFYKGMDTASKTLDGLTSTLKDDVATMGRSFSDMFLPAIKDVVKGLSEVAKWVGNLPEPTKQAIVAIAAFAAALGPLALGVAGVSAALAFLAANPAVLALAAIAAVVTVTIGLTAAAKNAAIAQQNLSDALAMTADLENTKKAITNVTKAIENMKVVLKTNPESEAMKKRLAQLQAEKEMLESNLASLERLQKKQKEDIVKPEVKSDSGMSEAKQALDKYNKEMLETIRLEKENRLSHEESLIKQKELTSDYINSLVSMGLVGGKSYSDLIQKEQELVAAISDKNEYDKVIAARSESYANAIKKQISEEEKDRTGATNKYNKQVKDRDDILKESSDAFDKLKSGEFKTFDDIEKAKIAAGKSGAIKQTDIDKAVTEAKIKLVSEYVGQAIKITSDMMSKIASIYNMDVDNKKKAIDDALKAAENAIDKELEAKEKAAGVATKTAYEAAQEELRIAQETYNGKLQLIEQHITDLDIEEQALLYSLGLESAATLEQYDAEIAKAIAAGDTTTAAKLKAERDKLAIQQDYNAKRKKITDAEALRVATDAATKAKLEQDAADKKKALEKQAALDTYKIEKAAFETSKALSITQAIIDTASAVMQSMKSLPWPFNLIPMGIVAGLGAAQVTMIANQKPPAPPALAEGGIVMPSNGGALVNVAEAGKPEVVFPLEKLDQFINQGNTGTGSNGSVPISMTIQLDSKTLYSGIFEATRNKTVLISTKALV